jgi:hypothetical protein
MHIATLLKSVPRPRSSVSAWSIQHAPLRARCKFLLVVHWRPVVDPVDDRREVSSIPLVSRYTPPRATTELLRKRTIYLQASSLAPHICPAQKLTGINDDDGPITPVHYLLEIWCMPLGNSQNHFRPHFNQKLTPTMRLTPSFSFSSSAH